MGVTVYKLIANDSDITALLKDYLISLTITDAIGDHSDSLTILLHDANEHIKFPQAGADLKVSLGTSDELYSFGTFIVDQVSYKTPPSIIELSAKSVPFNQSKQYQAMQTQHLRSFDQQTLEVIVKKIASEHGLEIYLAPDIKEKVVEHIDQTNESNVSFLHRLARLYNAKLKLTYEKILFLKDEAKTLSGQTILPLALNLDELSSLSYTTEKKISYQSVIAQYHDLDTGQTKEIKLGTREPLMRATYIYPDEHQARQMAEKILSHAKDDSDKLNFTLSGNPKLLSGMPIIINGLRADIPQKWLIKTATHSFSEGGYVTSVGAVIKKL